MSKSIDKLAQLTPEQKKKLAQKLKAKKREKLFPLSYAQQRMWFLNRLTPGSAVYNLPFALRIKGELNKNIFEKAIRHIINRHEILRTTFKQDGEKVRQAVSGQAKIALSFSDCPPDAINGFIQQAATKSFDLENGPLGEISLVQTAPDAYVMVMVMHHIISDGWSMGILIREFTIIYQALMHNKTHQLPPLKVQYADFAAWQKKWLRGERLQQQLAFWKKHLTSSPPVLELRGDKPRPRQLSARGAQTYTRIDNAVWIKLKELATKNGLTDFMMVLGLFYLLLHHYTRQDDICIGTPVANRNRAEIEPLIGFFVNTLVLRASFDANETAEEFFAKIKQTALDAYAHQDIPFEMLVQELQPSRDMSRSPLFQAFFTHTPKSGAMPELDNLRFEPVELKVETAKFELSLFTQESNDGLNITFEYNSDLYSDTFIQRLAGHFVHLAKQWAMKDIKAINQPQLLTEKERRLILEQFNNTAKRYPAAQPLTALFEEQAQKTPQATALLYNDQQITYDKMHKRALVLAGLLQEKGVQNGDFVGLCIERSPELVIGMYAILLCGAAYVPLDPDYPQERLRYMVEDSRASLILSSQTTAGSEALQESNVLIVDTSITPDKSFEQPVIDVDSPAYMIYTSGSTGKPKGVVIHHRAIWNRLQWMQETFTLTAKDRVLQKTPYSFDVSVWEFFWPLQTGATLVIAEPGGHKDPNYLQKLIRQAQITTIHFVPSMLQAFLNMAKISACTSLKRVICSGEALPRELVRQFFQQSKAELHNLYGPTEAAVDVTWWACSPDDAYASTPVGFPIANTQIYIMDEMGRLLPPGVAGELVISGVQVALGYHNRPQLTSEKFIPDPFSGDPSARMYRTGDLARYLPNGAIEFLGRIDHQVKLRGLRIELGEIENALKTLDSVEDAVVLVKDFPGGDQRLAAYVQSAQALETEQIQNHLSASLPDYMVPALYVRLDAIPLTPSGKVDRRALLAMETGAMPQKEYVQPANATEQAIADIFADLLGVEKVGATDSFFELGGHSLLATRLVAKCKDAFETEIPLTLIFEAPTVRALAGKIPALKGQNVLHLEKVDTSKPVPLSYAQQRLWFLEQLEPGSPFYNIPIAFRLKGHLNPAVLENAFNTLIQRHDALRTAIVTQDGSGFQIIRPSVSFKLDVRDLTGMQEDLKEKTIRNELKKISRHVFSLDQPPLFKVILITLSETENVLLGVIHHIISDQWSNQIILRELSIAYDALDAGRSVPLRKLERQYADFAVWQREWLDKGAMQSQLNWWRKNLQDAPPLLALPLDKPRPGTQTFNGAVIRRSVPFEISKALTGNAQKSGQTPFTQFLCYFSILLYRLSGEDDISIGIPVANRSVSATQSMIGFFVNTLVMRLNIKGHKGITAQLTETQNAVIEALKHQDIPFEKLVDELHPQRDMSHSPLFQVMFIYNEPDASLAKIQGPWQVEALSEHNGTAKFDLTLFVDEKPGGHELLFEYNSDLFNEETIERWASYFLRILETAAQKPDQPFAYWPILNESEKNRQLYGWNKPLVPEKVTALFVEFFSKIVVQNPDKSAVIQNETSLTFKELDQLSNQIAHELKVLGVKRENRVAIALPRCPDQIVTLMGIIKSGAAYVPIDLSYPMSRIDYMLQDAGVRLIIHREADREILPNRDIHYLAIEKLIKSAKNRPVAALQADIDAEQLAYMIYTSGSTGRPKGTLLTHGGLMHYLNWCRQAYPLKEGKGGVVHATIAFDATITAVFAPLLAALPITLTEDNNNLESLASLLTSSQEPYSLVKITPAHLDVLRQQIKSEQASRLTKAFIIGGENLTRDQIRFWQEHAPETFLFNEYGPTETVVGCVVFEAKQWDGEGSVPIGHSIPGTPVYILDSFLQPVPQGVAGELFIGGPAVARGYNNKPDVTAGNFLPDPFSSTPGARMYRSGDKVRRLADGNLIFLERVDTQVKVRGYRIEPAEIENILNRHSHIKNSVVIVRGKPARLLAYFTLSGQKEPGIKELREFLSSELPDYMIPAVFIKLDALPLTSNGKVDLKALPEPDTKRTALSTEYAAPTTEKEKILADIFSSLLKKDKVGIHDNFFELGGDSIMSIQVIARAAQQGLKITPLQMFQNQTIALLAGVAQTAPVIRAEQGLVSGTMPLVPIQHFFFAQHLQNENHWNQSVLLDVEQAMDKNALLKAIDAILRQHDALRLRFPKDGNPFFADVPDAENALEWVEVTADERTQTDRLVQEQANRLQASLNIETGPLFRVGYFKCTNGPDHLLLVAHHLCVDGVSWRILLEDFQLAYTQAKDNITLPPKSTSYKEWAETLLSPGVLDAFKTEQAYWLSIAQKQAVNLYPRAIKPNPENQTILESIHIDSATTASLLTDAQKAYNTQINDLLLTALLRAFSRWNGGRRMLLHFESHGRAPIADNVDISRTVGWFTAIYPVYLAFQKEVEIGDQVKAVKEQLARVPRNGIGYGLFRYHFADEQQREQLRQLDTIQIIYNYLGQFNSDGDQNAGFRPSQLSRGAERAGENERGALLDINGSILNGELSFSFSFTPNQFEPGAIKRFAAAFADEIQKVTQYCKNPPAPSKSASDFKMAGLKNKNLDNVLKQLGRKKR